MVALGARAVVEPGEPVDDPLHEQPSIGLGVEHRPLQRLAVECCTLDGARSQRTLAVGRTARVGPVGREASGEVPVEQFGERRLVMGLLDEGRAEHRAQFDAAGEVDVLDRPRRVEHLGERHVRAAPPEIGDEAFDLRPHRVLTTGHG